MNFPVSNSGCPSGKGVDQARPTGERTVNTHLDPQCYPQIAATFTGIPFNTDVPDNGSIAS